MANDSAPVQTRPADDTRAVRLTFAYRGDAIDLVAVQRVAMFVPPSDPLEDGPRSGFWIELRDAAGSAIFRLGMHHPMPREYEVFPANPRGEIVRQPVLQRAGAFTVVIPELSEARTLALIASPPALEARAGAAAEAARFDVPALMRRAEGDDKR